MSKIDELILAASTVPEKIKSEKGFKQVWFTRAEVKALVKLTAADCTNIVLHYANVDEGVKVAQNHFEVKT